MTKTSQSKVGLGYLPSPHVYDFIRDQEGSLDTQRKTGSYRRDRFFLYNDPAAHTTIGYGHKLTRDEIASGRFRDGLSEDEAEELLKKDVDIAARIAEKHFGSEGWETMSQQQRDAAVDHAFNLGAGGLKKFPRWSAALRRGDWETVQKESKRYYKNANTGEYEPLARRNSAYEETFVTPNIQVASAVAAQPEAERIEQGVGAGGGAPGPLLAKVESGGVLQDVATRAKNLVKDTSTQVREFVADWPRLGNMLMEVSAAEKERLAGKYGVEDANKEALKVADAAVKTLAETIGPDEQAWADYAERHPILTDPKSQFLLAMTIPVMPKGSRAGKAAKVLERSTTKRGTELAVRNLRKAEDGVLDADMRIVLPHTKSKTGWSHGENVEYSLTFGMDPQHKRVVISGMYPENLARKKADNYLEEGSNKLGARELREITQQIQDRFPFVDDSWMVEATRVGGRAGVMGNEGIFRKPFQYSVGRLAGKPKGSELSEKGILDTQKRINVLRTRTDLMQKHPDTVAGSFDVSQGVEGNLKEIDRLEGLLRVNKQKPATPSFDEWYDEVSEELTSAGVLEDVAAKAIPNPNTVSLSSPAFNKVGEAEFYVEKRLDYLDDQISRMEHSGLRDRLRGEWQELKDFLDDVREGLVSDEHMESVVALYRD